MNKPYYYKGELVQERGSIIKNYVNKKLIKEVLCIFCLTDFFRENYVMLKFCFLLKFEHLGEIIDKIKESLQLEELN